jgi:hypothetical protein
MRAIKVVVLIDEGVVRAIPALSPMLGRRAELIALEDAPTTASHKVTADELMASRIVLPPGSARTQDDLDRAISEGAHGR